MVDIVLPELDTLALTSQEVRAMTGWTDAMVEDYLTLARTLVSYAESIGSVANFAQEEATKAAQVSAEAIAQIQKRRAQLEKLARDIEAALINYVPLKGLMLQMKGAGTANPTIVNSYNLSALNRTGTGTYQITVQQNTFYGLDMFNFFVPVFSWVISPSANTALFSVDVQNTGSFTFNISVYEVTQGAGVALSRTLYDLQTTDTVALAFVLNAGDGRLPPP